MSSPTLRLYHHPFDAPSRRVRLALAEKALAFDPVIEKPWDPSNDLLTLNPSGEVPVLLVIEGKEEHERHALADAVAICEYIDDTTAGESLLGKDPFTRAEVRRLVGWFDRKFQREVTDLIIGEKAMKRLTGAGQPDSLFIRTGCANLRGHLDYIGWLTERRNWLAGDSISFADLAAAAQLSAIDYMGDVPWDQHILAKEWYARIKSRPAFRALLGDHITGFLPSKHYANLDF